VADLLWFAITTFGPNEARARDLACGHFTSLASDTMFSPFGLVLGFDL
jgi:hypothetical protein